MHTSCMAWASLFCLADSSCLAVSRALQRAPYTQQVIPLSTAPAHTMRPYFIPARGAAEGVPPPLACHGETSATGQSCSSRLSPEEVDLDEQPQPQFPGW